MPEISPSHREESLPEAQEQILTSEDYARLGQLFLETKENSQLFAGYRDQESVEARVRWRNEGRKAAAYLLEIINNTAHLATYESYQYACLLDLCASSDDARNIGALLLRDDVTLSGDRSFKSKFLRILERIGIPENADQLVQCAEKCLDAPYGSLLKKEDSMGVISVLWQIGLRIDAEYAEHEEDRRYQEIQIQLGDAGQRIRENLHNHTGEEITDYEEQLLGESLWYREAAFAPLFEVQEQQESDDSYDAYDYESDERNMSWEDEQDDAIANDYRENKFVKIEPRLEVIKRLRHEIKKEKEIKEELEDDENKFLRRHWLEYREDNPSPYVPTLGIEIEIREQSALPPPPAGRRWAEVEKERFLSKKKLQYKKTKKLGVPAGNDKFWEFAHAPTYYYATLSREVQALIEMGLINQDYPRHPLHITIGGVTLGVSMDDLYSSGYGTTEISANERMPENGKETFVLARSLEATGWSTTGGRLLRPYLAKGNRSAWAVKGVGGVKERKSDEIQLRVSKAVEFRTFQLQNFAGLDRTLRSAFLLGAALKAYQADAAREPCEIGQDIHVRGKLAEIWKEFSHQSRRIFSLYNLADPHTAWHAPFYGDIEDDRAKNPFKHFGDIIDEGRQHPQSRGAEFVAEMRGLIIKTRKKIADVIYQKPAL